MRTKRTLALVAGIALALALQGCGFKPRTNKISTEHLETIEINSQVRNGELTRSIKRSLSNAGVNIVDDADTVLHIHEESIGRSTATISSNGRTASFELTYVVRFSLERGDEFLINNRTVQSERSYRYDENDVSAKAEEENLLKREMRRRLVRKILNQISIAVAPPEEAAEEATGEAENSGDEQEEQSPKTTTAADQPE